VVVAAADLGDLAALPVARLARRLDDSKHLRVRSS
jgi:hypothetical protein